MLIVNQYVISYIVEVLAIVGNFENDDYDFYNFMNNG